MSDKIEGVEEARHRICLLYSEPGVWGNDAQEKIDDILTALILYLPNFRTGLGFGGCFIVLFFLYKSQ